MTTKISTDAALVLLKEFTVSTLSAIRNGEQDYRNLREPMGIDITALASLFSADSEALVSTQIAPNTIESLKRDTQFDIQDLKVAAYDLLNETKDLDGALSIQLQVEGLLQHIQPYDSSTPINHQELFENTMASLYQAHGLFGATDAIDDMFHGKEGQAVAFDQMHEDEFLASSMVVGMVALDIAEQNGVDIQAGLTRAEERANAKLSIEQSNNPPSVHWEDMSPLERMRALTTDNTVDDGIFIDKSIETDPGIYIDNSRDIDPGIFVGNDKDYFVKSSGLERTGPVEDMTLTEAAEQLARNLPYFENKAGIFIDSFIEKYDIPDNIAGGIHGAYNNAVYEGSLSKYEAEAIIEGSGLNDYITSIDSNLEQSNRLENQNEQNLNVSIPQP